MDDVGGEQLQLLGVGRPRLLERQFRGAPGHVVLDDRPWRAAGDGIPDAVQLHGGQSLHAQLSPDHDVHHAEPLDFLIPLGGPRRRYRRQRCGVISLVGKYYDTKALGNVPNFPTGPWNAIAPPCRRRGPAPPSARPDSPRRPSRRRDFSSPRPTSPRRSSRQFDFPSARGTPGVHPPSDGRPSLSPQVTTTR